MTNYLECAQGLEMFALRFLETLTRFGDHAFRLKERFLGSLLLRSILLIEHSFVHASRDMPHLLYIPFLEEATDEHSADTVNN